ncbi:wall-associated receptor kinase [Lecanosticta acicola]|uniref:Wall-associated receptor kinase n=1 Tax=Lecanosticta acicola TaxID=111012 RepID=A0AAI8Z0W1_9PEZI|nr:wall-associated receptor kinase [Lecanosticta acicola]
MFSLDRTTAFLALVNAASAQYGGGYGGYGGSGNPYSSGNNNGGFGSGFNSYFSGTSKIITAHAVLATLAFAFLFPVGGIMIRLASFRGLWLVHGLFQIFAYLVYIAAFGIGVWMISQRDGLINDPHPIIGIVLLVVLFFQPALGFVHHILFKRKHKRGIFSYGHIWLGRLAITLGIINGGLGLRYARMSPIARPSKGAIVAYGVVAGFIWLLYVISAIIGERRRKVKELEPPVYKEEGEDRTQYA